MKLLFCIKGMNHPGGGAERVLADITAGLVERGHEVAVLSYDQPGGSSYYQLNSEIKRIELGIGSTSEKSTLRITLQRIAGLRSAVCAFEPDVVVGFMHSMFIPLGLALLGKSIPLIASEHIVPEHYKARPIEAFLLRLTPLLADRITCVSEQVRQSFSPYIRKKMITIHNPMRLHPIGKADVLGHKKIRKTLLAVGRLEAQKDHELLVNAFVKIADQLPEWDLRIIGEGKLRSELISLTEKYGLQGRIFFPGACRNIFSEYLSAQLFVMPSRYESFGLTTAEALAYGLPAVGFANCPGTNQLIQHGVNGILVDDTGDRTDSLAISLEQLMKDDTLRLNLSKKSRGIPDKCSIDLVIDSWENLIDEAKLQQASGRQ